MVHFNDGFYDRYGYALLGKTLTHRKIIKMRRECMESWNELKGKYDQSQNWLKNTLLQDIHHYSHSVLRTNLRDIATVRSTGDV